MLKTNLTSSLVLPFLKDIYQTVILVFAELKFNLKIMVLRKLDILSEDWK